jgi:hypothetical protein
VIYFICLLFSYENNLELVLTVKYKNNQERYKNERKIILLPFPRKFSFEEVTGNHEKKIEQNVYSIISITSLHQ